MTIHVPELRLILGTAMWGWTVDQAQAFALADLFYHRGGRWFDTASNYPINKDASCYGLAERWLGEWALARAHDDVAVILKIGALANDGSSANDLTSGRLAGVLARARKRFAQRLKVVSLHWDHRSDAGEIADTIDFLRDVQRQGYRLGLSGIGAPQLYAELAPDLREHWWIQIKHNALTAAAYEHYAPFHGRATFLAYGLNGGGIKLGAGTPDVGASGRARGIAAPQEIASVHRAIEAMRRHSGRIDSLNAMSVVLALANADIGGILIGPSKAAQLGDTFDLVEGLSRPEARDLLTIAGWPV
jgi:aryl-alcohol dehydrogenase-like predicted oxidoreductase